VYNSGVERECLFISPSTATWSPRTLFVIHGHGDTARRFLGPWLPLVNDGWSIVVPQLSGDDKERALAELRQHLDDCRRKRGIDSEGMIVAGASEGAPLAIDIAREAGLPWLCLIPLFPSGYDLGMPPQTPGAFLLGELDGANKRTQRMIDTLRMAGATVHVRTMPGIGHDFPPDFAEQATSLLDALRS
jgi:predicted esterase